MSEKYKSTEYSTQTHPIYSEDIYIGVNSGTSLDAVDAALCKFQHISGKNTSRAPHSQFPQNLHIDSQTSIRLLTSVSVPLDKSLRQHISQVIESGSSELSGLGTIEVQLAIAYAAAVRELLSKWRKLREGESAGGRDVSVQRVRAVGAHGQTVFHAPDAAFPFSLQLLDGSKLAALAGLDVVCDFRRMDMAFGGQGAPLTPLFHRAVFTCTSEARELRFILNLGGIANVTVLEPKSDTGEEVEEKRQLVGFDTGPANCLLDLWTQRHFGRECDRDGLLAASGTVLESLLSLMLEEPYFQKPYPKSTGKELFNMRWIEGPIQKYKESNQNAPDPTPIDVLSTLAELTARTVALGIAKTGLLESAHKPVAGVQFDL